MSRWSDRNVWEPIKQQASKNNFPIQSEKAILQNFLGVLEKNKGGTLAGWNIGYQPSPQQQGWGGSGGFDIPMIMTRAKKYGMEDQFRSAIRGMKVKDIGAEYAWDIAKGVVKHGRKLMAEGVLDKDIHNQALGFVKAGTGLAYEYGARGSDVPRLLSQEGVMFSGWRQEMVHDIMIGGGYAAHQSEADIIAMREILEAGGDASSEDFIRRWAKPAMKNKLVKSALFRPRDVAEQVPERYAGILERAAEMEAKSPMYKGFKQEVIQGVREGVKVAGGNMSDVLTGKGIGQEYFKAGYTPVAEAAGKRSRVAMEALEIGAEFIRKYKTPLAIGAGAAALLAVKPGEMFSGKDDEYNTIEGLAHGGYAQMMRKQMTDFGSGWMRKALERGISAERVASAASKLGTGKSELSRMAFASETLKRLKADPTEGVKYVRSAQGISVEGQRWVYGKKLGSGAFGDAYMAYRAGGPAQEGVVKTLKNIENNPIDRFAKELRYNPAASPESFPMTPALHERLKSAVQSGDDATKDQIIRYGQSYVKEIAEEMNKRKINSLEYEAMMTRMAREQAGPRTFVPEVFAASPEAMVQEVAGKSIKGMDPARSKKLAEFLEMEPGYNLTNRSGVVHLDPHTGNVVRRGAKYAMIDYGLAVTANPNNQLGREMLMGPAYKEYVDEIASRGRIKKAAPGPIMTAVTGKGGTGSFDPGAQAQALAAKAAALGNKTPVLPPQRPVAKSPPVDNGVNPPASITKKQRFVQKHKESQIRASANATNPGRRHRQQTGTLVL